MTLAKSIFTAPRSRRTRVTVARRKLRGHPALALACSSVSEDGHAFL